MATKPSTKSSAQRAIEEFCATTTIDGVRELSPAYHMHPVGRAIWAFCFGLICIGVVKQIFDTTKQYLDQGTTTGFVLTETNVTQYRVMPVCVSADRMVHYTYEQYGVKPRAAQYLRHQWFAMLLQTVGVEEDFESEDMYIQPSDLYFPYSDVAYDPTWSWEQLASQMTADIALSREALADLINSNGSRYSWTVSEMFSIQKGNEYEEGGIMPFYLADEDGGTSIRGPYPSPGVPHLVCWDVKSTQVRPVANLNNHIIRFYIDTVKDKGIWVLYFTHFFGDRDVFYLTDYFEIEYPDRDYTLMENWITYNFEPHKFAQKDRRTYQCQSESEVMNMYHSDNLLRYPYGGEQKKCKDDCVKNFIERKYSCSFLAENMTNFCHQYHLMESLAKEPSFIDFFTDSTLKTLAEKAEAGGNVTVPGHSFSTNRLEQMLALMFMQVYVDAAAECTEKCKDATPMCDTYRFFRFGLIETHVIYENVPYDGYPTWNWTGPDSTKPRYYDIYLDTYTTTVYTEYKQMILMDTEDYVANLGGLTGFYLGMSVFSILHVFMFFFVNPLVTKTAKKDEKAVANNNKSQGNPIKKQSVWR